MRIPLKPQPNSLLKRQLNTALPASVFLYRCSNELDVEFFAYSCAYSSTAHVLKYAIVLYKYNSSYA